VFGCAVWAALTVATAALAAAPLATLVPLTFLSATFEAVFALHVGVERIGRCLAVFHDDRWEPTASAFGRPAGTVVLAPLFTPVFLIAAILHMVPLVASQPTSHELIFVGGAHALFVLRVIVGRIGSSRQRAIDTVQFEKLRQKN